LKAEGAIDVATVNKKGPPDPKAGKKEHYYGGGDIWDSSAPKLFQGGADDGEGKKNSPHSERAQGGGHIGN